VELDRIVDVFLVEPERGYPVAPAARQGRAAEPRIAPRAKIAAAAKTYLTEGNTAIKTDEWAEF
jgi:hypothetical protein